MKVIEIPKNYFCPYTEKIMHNPIVVNKPGGHGFIICENRVFHDARMRQKIEELRDAKDSINATKLKKEIEEFCKEKKICDKNEFINLINNRKKFEIAIKDEELFIPSFYLNLVLDRIDSRPLHVAIKKYNFSAVEFLINSSKVDVNAPDAFGNTPLHSIINLNSFSQLDFSNIELEIEKFIIKLLEAGANPNFENKLKYTPFYCAIVNRYLNYSIIEKFIVKGAILDPYQLVAVFRNNVAVSSDNKDKLIFAMNVISIENSRHFEQRIDSIVEENTALRQHVATLQATVTTLQATVSQLLQQQEQHKTSVEGSKIITGIVEGEKSSRALSLFASPPISRR